MKRKNVEKKVVYSARFVRENFGDRHKVAPESTFIKVWTFRNTGEGVWPDDALFMQTNGDNMEAAPFVVKGPVRPGQEVEVSMELKAPKLPGKYCAFFRFVYSDNLRFGQKVWCDILVDERARVQVFPPQSQQEGSSLLANQGENIP